MLLMLCTSVQQTNNAIVLNTHCPIAYTPEAASQGFQLWRFIALVYRRPAATCERKNESCHSRPPQQETRMAVLAATINKYPRSRPIGRFCCDYCLSPNNSSRGALIKACFHTCVCPQSLLCSDFLQVSALKTSPSFGL